MNRLDALWAKLSEQEHRTLDRTCMWAQWALCVGCLAMVANAAAYEMWHDAIGAAALALYCSFLALRNGIRGRANR